ncbi:hypothetical protein FHS85_002729 [Rhodoligotrophos appendicifer]|uniref:hypothetical protein n=1 Tax=Rhodoligotrophos appendicifer TaxID=987056 RepID=UPI001186299F|nr:hypothetical protein [Rhodoligotrophos appendicifer]
MRSFVWAVAFLLVGFVAGGALSYGAVQLLSSNSHDRDLEALYTAFFFAGPIAGVAGAIWGAILGARK